MTEDEILDAVRDRVLAGHPTDSSDGALPPEPASEAAVDEVQRAIGHPLPSVLRRLYLEVANGGVGPFTGIEGVRGGYTNTGFSMVDAYLEYLTAELSPEDPPPPGVFYLCDSGCAMSVWLDCRHPEGQMWWWDEGDRHKLDLTPREWFNAWLAGSLDHHYMETLVLREESWCRPGCRVPVKP